MSGGAPAVSSRSVPRRFHSSSSQASMSAVLRLGGMTVLRYEAVLLGMADVLLGTMRSSARGDCDRRLAHHLLTRGNDVTTLFDRQRRPRPERPLGGRRPPPPGGSPGAGRRSRRARPDTARSGVGPARSPPRRTRRRADRPAPETSALHGKAGSPGSWHRRTRHPPGLELGGRLLDGPVVGAHHEDRGRRPSAAPQLEVPPGTDANRVPPWISTLQPRPECA